MEPLKLSSGFWPLLVVLVGVVCCQPHDFRDIDSWILGLQRRRDAPSQSTDSLLSRMATFRCKLEHANGVSSPKLVLNRLHLAGTLLQNQALVTARHEQACVCAYIPGQLAVHLDFLAVPTCGLQARERLQFLRQRHWLPSLQLASLWWLP